MEEKEIVGKTPNSFSQLIYKYFPFWPLFALLIIIACAVAWNYIRFLDPMYEATASIMIKDNGDGAGESKILESLNFLEPKKSIQNEIELIQSKSLMKEVVLKLHLYAPIYEVGKLKEVSAYTTSPIMVKAKDPENIKDHEKVFFIYNEHNKSVKVGNEVYPLNKWMKTPYGNLMFSKNEKQEASTPNPLFFTLIHPKRITNFLRGGLNVVPSNRNSSLVILRFKNDVPRRAEDILNTLAEVYSRSSINSKNALAANTLAFVEDRIKYVENDLDSVEKSIQRYKSTKGIIDLSSQGELFLNKISANDQKLAEFDLQLTMLDQIEKYVVSKDSRGGVVPSTMGVTAPLLNELVQRLYATETQYEKLRKTTAENNPAILAVKSEIEKIRPSILEHIQNQRNSIRVSMQNLSSSNNAYASMVSSIPQKEKELLDFSRQQAIKNSVYTFLLQKREETALSHAGTVADNQLIDPAESSMIPHSPRKSVIYFLAGLLGLLLGLGFITMKELLTTKILFRSEIEEYTTVPIVAELVKVRGKEPLVVNRPEQVFVAEQFRQLRAAIGLYGKIKSKRKILITSSISGEGKSFVCANLALSLALAGKKVVLLDMDIRNPRSSEIFGLTESKGVSEFLELDIEPFEIIKQTAFDQLFVVPSGNTAMNSTELLLGGKLDSLFEYLKERFDYIIADTAPVDPVTDAYVLSDYFDTTLYVIRHGYTPKTMIQVLDENNKIKALKNMAIVFNSVRPRGFMRKGYGYGYGYGYENVYKDQVYKRKVKHSQS